MSYLLWSEGTPGALGEGAEDQPTLVPYLVEGNGELLPAVIVCPGGGYGRRAEHEGAPIAKWLNELGISAFVLHYRVAPYQHPQPLNDAQRAVRMVRHRAEEWGVDKQRVGILGFSAGGHLASSAATHYDSGRSDAGEALERESSRPDLAVLCYPVISMGEHTHAGSRENLLGQDPSEELAALLSSELQVTSDTPPCFIWHTADDGAVPVENALLMASSLSKARVPFELHVYESGRHGLGLAKDEPEAYTWTELCGLWLRKRGF